MNNFYINLSTRTVYKFNTFTGIDKKIDETVEEAFSHARDGQTRILASNAKSCQINSASIGFNIPLDALLGEFCEEVAHRT